MIGKQRHPLADHGPAATIAVRDGLITAVDSRVETLTAYSADSLRDAPLETLVSQAVCERAELCREQSAPATSSWVDGTLLRRDATRLDARVCVTTLPDATEGCLLYCHPTPEAVTDTPVQTPATEDTYKRVFDAVNDAVFILDVDADGTIRFSQFNAREESITGKSTADVRGKTPVEAFGETTGSEVESNYRRCLETAAPLSYEEQFEFDGRLRTWHTTLTPITTDGSVTQIVGIGREVTTLKAREKEITALKDRLELAVEAAELGVWDWDLTTDTLTFNDRWATMLGYAPEAIEPHVDAWEQRVHPADRERVTKALHDHLGGTSEYYTTEHRMRTADGEWLWVCDIGRVTERSDDGEPLRAVGIHMNIDDRKPRERRLKRQKALADHSSDHLIVLTADGHVEYQSDQVVHESRVTLPNAVDEPLNAYVHPSHTSRAREAFATVSADPGATTTVELRIQTVDDGWRWFDARAQNLLDIPPIDGILVSLRDITEMKQYESQLESQRDALEVLTETICHDIRNNLQSVLGYGDLLKSETTASAEEYLHRLLDAASEAVSITTDAREVTQTVLRSPSDRIPIPIGSLVRDQVTAAATEYEAAQVRLCGDVPAVDVLADDMLESVFRNLLGNAVRHNDKPTPRVEVSLTHDSDQVCVHVADNGPGISGEEQHQIFEHGASGSASDGTGLGLYLVAMLVERYDGEIDVTPNDPHGTVFSITLPTA